MRDRLRCRHCIVGLPFHPHANGISCDNKRQNGRPKWTATTAESQPPNVRLLSAKSTDGPLRQVHLCSIVANKQTRQHDKSISMWMKGSHKHVAYVSILGNTSAL